MLSADETQEVGKITKQWGGLAKEYFTDADNFGIQCKRIHINGAFRILYLHLQCMYVLYPLGVCELAIVLYICMLAQSANVC